MFALDDETTMVARAVRQWCTAVLAPKVPALEHGTEQPFDLMKNFAKTFALGQNPGDSRPQIVDVVD